MTTLVLTAIGDDRSGLVDALSGTIAEHGGNWDRSHMSELAGKFAGIVLVTVPDNSVDALIGALQPLEQQGLLDITVSRADEDDSADDHREMALQLVGQDRVGIIRDLSHALAALGVSIQELETATSNAPMAGGMLFEARAALAVPGSVDLDQLQATVEALSNELMVDIDLGGSAEA